MQGETPPMRRLALPKDFDTRLRTPPGISRTGPRFSGASRAGSTGVFRAASVGVATLAPLSFANAKGVVGRELVAA